MSRHKPFLIKHATVYAENSTYEDGFIAVSNGKIEAIGSAASISSSLRHKDYDIFDAQGKFAVIPGMIDVHIHGAGGADTMDATPEALETMKQVLPREGTTSFLATTITQSGESIEKALRNAAKCIRHQSAENAELLGIHLEGPFISPKRAGAQPLQFIQHPDVETFKKWQQISDNTIKLVTLAPEEKNGLELIKFLNKSNIVASIGHSDATFVQVDEAISAGAAHVTHLFNGMRGMHHREPGTAGAALTRDELYVEIIADGIHVHPEMIKLAYKSKSCKKIILITDSIRAKWLNQGTSELGGQTVTVKDGKALLPDGTLAGSILKMNTAIQNFKKFTNCSVEEIIQMTSVNPAKQLNIFDRKGSLKPGKDADLVVVDQTLDVQMTYCKGNLAYQKGKEDRKWN